MRIEQGGDDGQVVGRAGGSGHVVAVSAAWRRGLIGIAPVLAALAVCLVTAATASAFSAHGSVEQVYVTGLAPGAQMSLLGEDGETVSTQTADSLGGLLFRNVAPGKRYRVTLTSNERRIRADHRPHAEAGAVEREHLQTDDPEQRLRLPDDARRHPAGDRRPPADLPADEAQRRGSDADRILGVRLREPRGPESGLARWPTRWASRSSTSTCAVPAARAAPSTTSNRCRTSMRTT